MPTLNPYLTFNGNCNEAMNFYKDVLGGELTVMIAGESPVANEMPAEYHSQVLHAHLKSDTLEIMATDMIPKSFDEGNTVHLCLICKNEREMRTLYNKLSSDGEILEPMHEMFFGFIGGVKDRFGKHWMLQCDKN